MIGQDIPYTNDDERTALSLALAALEGESESWATLVEGSPDQVALIAALSDWVAALAHDFATAQGQSGESYLKDALIKIGFVS